MVAGINGITVSGVGSQANPFVINGPYLTVGNTATADLTLTGAGTSASPYRITATVHMTLDDLTDVIVPTPTVGYVLTYQTSPSPGWRAAVAQSGTPGAVLTDGSLSGAGTAGSVLSVKVDPAGGISVGAGGLTASAAFTICTSTTRPASPTNYQRIVESDTQAYGFWMPGSPGSWRMFDTKPQLWTPHLTSGYYPNVDIATSRGGYARGTFMRQGAQTHVGVHIRLGDSPNMGYGDLRIDNPPVPIASVIGAQFGIGFLNASGWAYWPAQFEANSAGVFRWWTSNPGEANIWIVQSADSTNRPGTGVPQRPGTYPFLGGSDLEGFVTYFND